MAIQGGKVAIGGSVALTSLSLARLVMTYTRMTIEGDLRVTGGPASQASQFRATMLDDWASGASFLTSDIIVPNSTPDTTHNTRHKC